MAKFKLGETVRVKGFDAECKIRVVHEPCNVGQMYAFVVDGRMSWHTAYEQEIKSVFKTLDEVLQTAVIDPVNHPKHYTSHPSGVECIQITEHMGFNLGNALKYIWRADLKGDAIEDMKKAVFYLNRELALRNKSTTSQHVQGQDNIHDSDSDLLVYGETKQNATEKKMGSL